MNKKNRMYSLPYNGTDVDWFLQEAEKRKKNIDHIFLDIPLPVGIPRSRDMFCHVENVNSYNRMYNHVMSCVDLLKKSKGNFRRLCTLNAMYYPYQNAGDFFSFIQDVCDVIVQYAIDGVIVTDYRVARAIHKKLPEVDIQTSCNGYQWNTTQMEIWRETCGTTTFNPPREILRSFSKLKEMHDMGFRLKCLVNEACLMGCPNTFNHSLSIALRCLGTLDNCCQRGIGDILRANYILPRWQKYYDEYVDVYKISGRESKKDYPFFALDAYLREENSIPLSALMHGGTMAQFKKNVPVEIRKKLTLDKIPDKLMTCECKNCKQCGLCEKIAKTYIPKEYWDKFYAVDYGRYFKENR